MKFVSLRLCNWRSFHGESILEFSTDPQKPVTLIFGSNGAGKTALLNAFTWVIYGDFTDGFDRRNDLINHEAKERGLAAEVELSFTNDGHDYKIKRTVTPSQQTTHSNEVFVSMDGRTIIEDSVHQILPKALKDLFFFPAETFGTAKILRAQDKDSKSACLDIDAAIRTLLAGDVYDNAVKDLRNAVSSAALKTPAGVSDTAIAKAEITHQQAQQELTNAQEQCEQLPAKIRDAAHQAEQADQHAKQFDKEKLDEYDREHSEKLNHVSNSNNQIKSVAAICVRIARHAHGHFSDKAVAAAINRLDTAEKFGLIPPRIDGRVLENSIKSKLCRLCGETLTPNGTKRAHRLLAHVADSTTALRCLEARSEMATYVKRNNDALAILREDVARLAGEFTNVSVPDIDADLTFLSASVRECVGLANATHRQAVNDLKLFEEDRTAAQPVGSVFETRLLKQQALRRLEEQLDDRRATIPELKAACKEALNLREKKSKGSKDASLRAAAIGLLETTREFFESARDGLTEFGRIDFERAINETYKDLIRKPYELRVDDSFHLELFTAGTDTQVAPSQAENVLLLIAFLGAIARLAPKYQQVARDGAQFRDVGSIETSASEGFPVVIDAPTSALDDQYEHEVIRTLPNLLEQIIIPVSAKSLDAWETIKHQVGRVFVIELTSKEQDDRLIRWKGRDHTYSRRDDSIMTRSRIVEIN